MDNGSFKDHSAVKEKLSDLDSYEAENLDQVPQ